MPNRFGLRHAVLSLLLLSLTVSVWLNMLQLDRVWDKLGEVRATQDRLEEAIVRLERRGGSAATAPDPAAGGPSSPPVAVNPDAWARPGVPIKRAQRPAWISDPTKEPDYQEGGVIVEVLEQDLAHIVPYRGSGSNTATTRVLSLVQERLADFNPRTLVLEGVLAEAWQMDPSGLWLRVKVRDDAVWSDGEPVTADDVKFTLDIIRNPAYPTAMFRPQFEAVAEARVLGDRVLEVTFSEALYSNEDATMRVAPLPRHVYGKLTPEQFAGATGILIGSGPYMLANATPTMEGQWTAGKPVELVRNPRWRGPTRPAEGFRFSVVTDAGSRLAALKNREADIARGVPEHLRALADSPVAGTRAVTWAPINTGPAMIIWNTARRPEGPSACADVRVRNALTHALDRERMNRELFGGAGKGVSGPFPQSQPSYDPAVIPLPFNMDRAGTLLDEAGWVKGPNGKRTGRDGTPLALRIIAQAGIANGESWSAYLRDQLALLGAECEVDLLDNTAYGEARRTRDFDGLIAAWSPDSPEPNMKQRFHSSSIRSGGSNDGQWSNPEADRLIDRARRTLDPDARNALWREFHRLVHREQPVTFIVSRPLVMLVSDRIGNFPMNPMAMGSDRAEMYVRKAGP